MKDQVTQVLFTVQEVAEILKVAEGTIRNKISQGEIKAVKVFDCTRITKAEIERLIRPMKQ